MDIPFGRDSHSVTGNPGVRPRQLVMPQPQRSSRRAAFLGAPQTGRQPAPESGAGSRPTLAHRPAAAAGVTPAAEIPARCARTEQKPAGGHPDSHNCQQVGPPLHIGRSRDLSRTERQRPPLRPDPRIRPGGRRAINTACPGPAARAEGGPNHQRRRLVLMAAAAAAPRRQVPPAQHQHIPPS